MFRRDRSQRGLAQVTVPCSGVPHSPTIHLVAHPAFVVDLAKLTRQWGRDTFRLMTLPVIIMKPSAFLPVSMSLAALAVVLFHVAIFGIARESDEGAAAHIWQLLMAGQLPLLLFFAVRWLPRSPKQAAQVMAIQAGAAITALAPVYFLDL